jgi:Xaa-Pro aminopeptidase
LYPSKFNTPKSELDQRINDLQNQLMQENIDAALILQRTDLFYFSGTVQQANLFIPAEGEPMLLVVKSSERAMAESSIARIVPLTSPKKIPGILKQNGYELPDTLGLELDVLPANLYFYYRSIFEKSNILDISSLIRTTRSVKSPYEIDIMRQAARLSDRVAGSVPNILREGMTELELAGRIEAEARKLGHQGIVRMRLWGNEMFYGHLMSGPEAAVPSFLSSPTGGAGASPAVAQGPSSKPVRRHEPVLLDYVFAYNGYLSDHTRVFSLGALPQELVEAHAAMLDIQRMVKKKAVPGVKSGIIYELALERAEASGYGDYFMGADRQRIRFVGHGIGLELDEYPFLAAGQDFELAKGMILAIEPKLVFPGKGVVGIENTHLVTEKGLEQFGAFPDEIVVI